ncbi:MoaD/ThiS family protein [Spartinivicinus ruber]|uniref:MoaD/ThiS family protein n=1 Tax=Spartinivicinus ruber TaxID=2683272 RepID=UPI0013D80196|nr:MoaD/ThiS family protein [Spartinivicinus ruber]
MKLQVKLFGPLRLRAGAESFTIELINNNLASAIKQLCNFSELKGALLRSDGELCQSVIYLIGNEQVNVDDNPGFQQGDVLTLLAPISGG